MIRGRLIIVTLLLAGVCLAADTEPQTKPVGLYDSEYVQKLQNHTQSLTEFIIALAKEDRLTSTEWELFLGTNRTYGRAFTTMKAWVYAGPELPTDGDTLAFVLITRDTVFFDSVAMITSVDLSEILSEIEAEE